MRRNSITPETLNAYVDGELARADAAAVARAAAHDPSIAGRIATLRELKAAVAEIAPERDLALPPPSLVSLPYAAVAAVLLVMVALATLLHVTTFGESPSTRWANMLQERHAAWTFAPGTRDAGPVPASGAAGMLPLDLQSARLAFAGHERIRFAGREIYRTGYEGTRGCRVSLFMYPAGTELDGTAFSKTLLVRTWVIDRHGYALMADGMAGKRFNSLAAAVEKALRAGRQFDSGTRQQLALARRTSPPCQA